MKNLLCLVALALPATARVVHFAIEHRENTGCYERLTGHFSGALDPAQPLNAIINDLALAPRNAAGQVEYTATFTLIVPRNSSGVLWYEVPNRGTSRAPCRMDRPPPIWWSPMSRYGPSARA